MADRKARSTRDRREADLVLDVAIAHWAFNSAKDPEDRKTTHERFKNAVRILYEFVTTEDLEITAPESGPGSLTN